MPPRMQQKYREEVVQRLRDHYNYANVMQVPKIEKIVVNIGMGEALTDANALDRAAVETTGARYLGIGRPVTAGK